MIAKSIEKLIAIKRWSKELMQKIKQRQLKAITLQGVIEKSNIAFTILKKL